MSEPKSKGGRPTTITEEKMRQVQEYLATGSTVDTASAAAGIAKDTLYVWLRNGRRDITAGVESLSAKFVAMVDEATHQHKARMLSVISYAAEHKGQWQAAAWLLERRYPEEFGRPIRLAIDPKSLTDEALGDAIRDMIKQHPELLFDGASPAMPALRKREDA